MATKHNFANQVVLAVDELADGRAGLERTW